MTAVVLQGDARSLPLPDASVDLIVTSPPYFGLRSYTDGGEHYAGQIGSEATPAEWVANLVDCTREWVRVLKPSGSIFVNLGDKYAGSGGNGNSGLLTPKFKGNTDAAPPSRGKRWGHEPKSLLGLPWRYALACMDELGLILRRDIIWSKPNGLPESVTDRCRSSHEYLFHLVKQPRYYAAVDEIREPHEMRPQRRPNGHKPRQALGVIPAQTYSTSRRDEPGCDGHALGKLPGSVWDIPSQPLAVPPHLGIDHFAAFPMELPRRIIAGWSPPGVCTACDQGRRPVADVMNVEDRRGRKQRIVDFAMDAAHGPDGRGGERWRQTVTITGYACACTPYTDHPATGERTTRRDRYDASTKPHGTYGRKQAGEYERVGPWREYHLDGWVPPSSRPAIVADPFGGTGTAALVADVLGRTGISFDLSADYCRLARWRTTDPGERARAMQVPKPPPVPDGQQSLFGGDAA